MLEKDPLYDRAIEMLEKFKKFPRMMATDYEAWINIVSTIILFVIPHPSFNNREFHAKHLGTHGSSYLNLQTELNDEWAQAVADDAINILKKWKLKAFL